MEHGMRARRYYEAVMHTVAQLDLTEDLAAEGFTTFKQRQPGR